MQLDRLLPDYDVHEVHSILVLVHPGSAFIRRMWLRALKRRAETASPAQK